MCISVKWIHFAQYKLTSQHYQRHISFQSLSWDNISIEHRNGTFQAIQFTPDCVAVWNHRDSISTKPIERLLLPYYNNYYIFLFFYIFTRLVSYACYKGAFRAMVVRHTHNATGNDNIHGELRFISDNSQEHTIVIILLKTKPIMK